MSQQCPLVYLLPSKSDALEGYFLLCLLHGQCLVLTLPLHALDLDLNNELGIRESVRVRKSFSKMFLSAISVMVMLSLLMVMNRIVVESMRVFRSIFMFIRELR